MMRVNALGAADSARLLEAPLVLLVNAADDHEASEIANEIERMRTSGELAPMIAGMGISLPR